MKYCAVLEQCATPYISTVLFCIKNRYKETLLLTSKVLHHDVREYHGTRHGYDLPADSSDVVGPDVVNLT